MIINSNIQSNYRKLHKFGGSSLANVECYQRVSNIIIKNTNPGDLIVVSASGKTTDQLIKLIDLLKNNISYKNILLEIINYQMYLIKNLLEQNLCNILEKKLNEDLSLLKEILNNKIIKINFADIISYGEVWSARLMSYFLMQKNISSKFLDSRKFLIASKSSLPEINIEKSLPLLKNILNKNQKKIFIITGFICKDDLGNTMLLGRNGSDYSATQIGCMSNVDSITIWSDVSGIYSADPRKVKNAFLIPYLTLDEANELARLGAPVLHKRTLHPIYSSNTKLLLKSSFNNSNIFTTINKKFNFKHENKIITSNNNIVILEIKINLKSNFIKICKIIKSILHLSKILPLAMYQDKKKYLLKLCYVNEIVDDIFNIIKNKNIKDIQINKKIGYSIIAIINQTLKIKQSNIDDFYKYLKNMQLEFLYIPKNNISIIAVIKEKINEEIIQKIHNNLIFKKKIIGLVLFGKGNIGLSWLKLFIKQYLSLSKKTKYKIILSGIINSTKQLLEYNGINLDNPLSIFSKYSIEKEDKKINYWMKNHPFNQLVIIDITASNEIAKKYSYFAKNNFHVISANKLASGSFNNNIYKKIKCNFNKNNCYWFYNATVGAGLPINYVIKDLLDCGDSIVEIKGIFSGTLSWLFNKFDGSIHFTTLLKKAWDEGLTEPDPRIDLSGQDVMRKLIILARDANYNIDINNIKIESLISNKYKNISLSNFFHVNNPINFDMLNKLNKAKKENLVMRYVAGFNKKDNKSYIGLTYVKLDHPLATINPCDNIFTIESHWYNKNNKLIIRGPGAGKKVTAGAIQSDINRLITLL